MNPERSREVGRRSKRGTDIFALKNLACSVVEQSASFNLSSRSSRRDPGSFCQFWPEAVSRELHVVTAMLRIPDRGRPVRVVRHRDCEFRAHVRSGASTPRNDGQSVVNLTLGDMLTVVNYSPCAGIAPLTQIVGTQANGNSSTLIDELPGASC